MKSRGGKSQRKEKKKEDQGRGTVRRQKLQVSEKVAKSQNTVFFQWSVAPEGRKVGQRVRSHLARWEMKNCTPLPREAHFQVKMLKTPHVRTTFGSWYVEKVHAVVQNAPCSEQALLEVDMTKKCTLLWREAHFQVKMYKAHHARSKHVWKLACRKSVCCCGAKHISKSKCVTHTMLGASTFGSWHVEKVPIIVARSTFPSQNDSKRTKQTHHSRSKHFWKLTCRKSAGHCGAKHISKSKSTKHTMLGASTFGRWHVERVDAVVARSTFPSQNDSKRTKHTMLGASAFGSWHVEKVHAIVARSTFPSQNAQNTPCLEQALLECRKSACCCGAKHISKSKSTKHTMSGPLLEVQISKKRTLLCKTHHARSKHFWKLTWRKSARCCGAKHISKSKCTKHTMLGASMFGSWHVEKVHAVEARSTFPSQNVQSRPCSEQALLEVDTSKKVHAVVGQSTFPSQNV